jgi:hypothetical protein
MLVRIIPALLLTAAVVAAATKNASPVTFHKDVLPILQENCQKCHRAGEAAPMSLLNYAEARPWAQAIREAVLLKRMPPWFADARYGNFSNTHALSQTEIETLVAWADNGAPEGDPAAAPAAAVFAEGWNIGEPDVVIEMPEAFEVPAAGTIDYHYLVLPTNFGEDKWVQAAEVRPGNRAVVHHVIAFVRPPGSQYLEEAEPGKVFLPQERKRKEGEPERDETRELLVGFAPGMEEGVWKDGYAKLLPAGADIIFQLHYTANGKPATDKTSVGLVFAKEKPSKRVVTLAAMDTKFEIPPGAPNHEVKTEWILNETVELVSLMPHMHLRGKDFLYKAFYPTGESEILLNVPRYDFNWQFFYYLKEPKLLPKGTRLDCTAHFDNSPNNPANPDPAKEVRWGDQSWEEMMIGWFEIAMDPDADVKSYTKKAKTSKARSD